MDERDLPEGVIDADPPGGWDPTGDGEAQERSAAAEGSADLVESDEPSKGVDPDLGTEQDA